jgi:hypothetical protein
MFTHFTCDNGLLLMGMKIATLMALGDGEILMKHET